ncbi:MAG: NAD-dependent malic enzyme [Deltaproteobacteria bacterium]|nr:NAD-dependent malic enzyme [Deltaproteobacteria bacterium]
MPKPRKPAVRRTLPRGAALLHDPIINKGTAFSKAERDALGLRGLLPPHVHTIEEQVRRALDNYRAKKTDIERYIHLVSLQDRNETLFYRVVAENLEEMMPIIYTPTVGTACQQYGHVFRRPRGMYLSAGDKGRFRAILANWPYRDVRVIVVTDGERILGLGDLGASGMGIPVGKLSLYTACAGINPVNTLPVLLDVGTENEALLNDPLYMGIRRRRVRGPAYDELVDEFMTAAGRNFPGALIQFEDFANINAFRLLEKYREKVLTFNDDIQGTASVTLAGLYSAMRITRRPLGDQTILFLGAGEAGIGIGDLIVSAMVDEGLAPDEARRRCWFVDSSGLVVRGREGLAAHKLRFAHDHAPCPDLAGAVEALRPTALIGVSTSPKAFTRPIVERMGAFNEHPIVFALSNPTSKAECSAEEAYNWTGGRAIFASGSPFPPCVLNGRTYVPGQGNNAYVFPGVGLGAVACEARHITDRMFSEAAKALAACVLESDLEMGRIYPSLTRIREVSANIGAAVAAVAFKDGLARIRKPANLLRHVKSVMWKPEYVAYV